MREGIDNAGKIYTRGVRGLLFLVISGIVILLDQSSKHFVSRHIQVGESWPLLGDLLALSHVQNTGGAFGIFPGLSPAFAVLGFIVVVLLILVYLRLAKAGKGSALGLALVIGGALGNFIDRVRFGWVVDFLDLHFWPVFNFADVGITIGIGLLVFSIFSRTRRNTAADESKRQAG